MPRASPQVSVAAGRRRRRCLCLVRRGKTREDSALLVGIGRVFIRIVVIEKLLHSAHEAKPRKAVPRQSESGDPPLFPNNAEARTTRKELWVAMVDVDEVVDGMDESDALAGEDFIC